MHLTFFIFFKLLDKILHCPCFSKLKDGHFRATASNGSSKLMTVLIQCPLWLIGCGYDSADFMFQRNSRFSRCAKERLPEGADLDLAGGYFRRKLWPSEVGTNFLIGAKSGAKILRHRCEKTMHQITTMIAYIADICETKNWPQAKCKTNIQ